MKNNKQVQITTQGIKKALQKYTLYQAIIEYIWNGFDAYANQVNITISNKDNDYGYINNIKINDNGIGIPYEELKTKFKPFYDSEKKYNPNVRSATSTMHGEKGIGRLTFFKFAQSATWTTIYKKNNKNYQYSLSIMDYALDSYDTTKPEEINSSSETTVTFKKINDGFIEETLKENLINEFGWFLELHKHNNYSISINGEELNYSSLVNGKDEINILHEQSKTCFNIRFILWNNKLTKEFSKCYFINLENKLIHRETTKLNNKGDSFFHSIYIKSKFFDNFTPKHEKGRKYESGGLKTHSTSKSNEEYDFLIHKLYEFLKAKRKPFLKNHSEKLVEQYKKNKIFPQVEASNQWDFVRLQQLEDFVKELYQVEPKIFTNLNMPQQKTFIHLLNLIMDNGEQTSLFEIIQEVIELDSNERIELSNVLKLSKLSSVIKTTKLIQDRYRAIDELKKLVFEPQLKANERDHLQKFIEKHYWLFGEQFHLVTAAEPKFEEALRRYQYLLKGEKKKKKIDHPDKNKEMDIFMARQSMNDDYVNNIVVELKHPDIPLGEKQLRQVKKYLNVILNEPEFNSDNMKWEFYLIGKKFTTNKFIESEIKNAKHHGEKSLVFRCDNYKIFVKKWSEIFIDFELKHSFLNEKLNIEKAKLSKQNDCYKSADDIIENIDINTAIQDPELVIPN